MEDYVSYCRKYKVVWDYLVENSKSLDDIVKEVCDYRLYFNSYDRWYDILSTVGVACVSSRSCDLSRLKSSEFEDLGLFSSNDYFLLEDRYIIPIRDMVGNIIALVGWYSDSKKYITTPSKYFTKSCLFFGMEQISNTGLGGNYFLVEGIFDCLSLRSLGFNAISMMGVSSSNIKEVMYGLFGKLVAIPDSDNTGRSVITYDKWSLPSNGTYFRWVGKSLGEDISIKDVDRLCSLYDEDDLVELFSSLFKVNSRVVKVEI